ncbi:MAG: hypothetical protein H6559_34515 [Lewinellaceae bacterium]|nr:hypothetical protein [Lewinellaceae bacterium]
MRIKIFSIPVVGGERLAQEMNAFLSSKKILEVDKQLVSQGQNAFWSFCITYIEGGVVLQPDKVDYREVLDEYQFPALRPDAGNPEAPGAGGRNACLRHLF